MKMGKLSVSFLIIGWLALGSCGYADETLTLETYYPAPYGDYANFTATGNVGIGTTSVQPGSRLYVYHKYTATDAIDYYGSYLYSVYSGAATTRRYAGATGFMEYQGSGDSTVRPLAGLRGYFRNNSTAVISQAAAIEGTIWSTAAGTITIAEALRASAPYRTAGTITNSYGLHVWNMGTTGVTNAYGVYIDSQEGASTRNYTLYCAGNSAGGGNLTFFAGNVGIGVTVPTARLEIAGNFKAALTAVGGSSVLYNSGTIGLDIAELFEASEEVEPGDVLVIDKDGKLRKCYHPYDMKVAGIVSAAPAILFEGSQLQIAPTPFEFTKGNKPPVALAGRVYVKATAANGPIQPGDLLTTSSVAGHAMLAKQYKPGTILGKALEPLDKKEGKIKALLTLQ